MVLVSGHCHVAHSGPRCLTIWDRRLNILGHWASIGAGMPRLVRSAALSHYPEVAKSVGLDPYRMIAACGLPAVCLTDPEAKVPAAAVALLLEESARRSGKDDFGLRLADQRTLSNLGPLALLVREQPTIRKALEALVAYIFLHSEALHLKMEQQDGVATLSLAIEVGRPGTDPPGRRDGNRIPASQPATPSARKLEAARDPFHPCGPGTEGAASPVLRDSDRVQSGVQRHPLLRSRDLEAAVPAADATMARYVQRYLDTLAARRNSTMSASVRECIYLMLPSGLCSADHVARRLGVDRRTVNRHLAREGETFSSVVDSVRAELVTRYIDNRDRPLASVAELLGFSAHSAFSRWFRHRFGCSVSAWRSRGVRKAPPAPARAAPRSARATGYRVPPRR